MYRPTLHVLYLIEILHQTTTRICCNLTIEGCILSKFYIKPQHFHPSYALSCVVSYRNSTSNHNVAPSPSSARCCILSKFYIKPQRQQDTYCHRVGCILSKFYIKPQPLLAPLPSPSSCILSKFYIKPQLSVASPSAPSRCILSKFYIKPQRYWCALSSPLVVSYRNSTSNHNIESGKAINILLYLIEILHQTTTENHLSR